MQRYLQALLDAVDIVAILDAGGQQTAPPDHIVTVAGVVRDLGAEHMMMRGRDDGDDECPPF